MTQQIINVGSRDDDPNADPGRLSFQKVNANFTELYTGISRAALTPSDFGAVGNGSTNDTGAIQAAFTYCSNYGRTLQLPVNAIYRVTSPLFMWGDACVVGVDDNSAGFNFDLASNYPYVVNFGISAFKSGATNYLQTSWDGVFENCFCNIVNSVGAGRLLYFWRTNRAELLALSFSLGNAMYSATSSGNDENYVYQSSQNCIRKSLTIKHCEVSATADSSGSEGFGIKDFTGADLIHNKVSGVGDDMIGVHNCTKVRIIENELAGVDGGVFLSATRDFSILSNKVSRMAQVGTGTWFAGAGLMALTWETFNDVTGYANSGGIVDGNTLIYPAGSIDTVGAFKVYGPRDTTLTNNTVVCNASGSAPNSYYWQPADFTGSNWTDPTGIDPPGLVAKVHELNLFGNESVGDYARPMTMTGAGGKYAGSQSVQIRGNLAPAYSVYGQGSLVGFGNDNEWTKPSLTDASGTLVLVDQAGSSGQEFDNSLAVAAWHYVLPAAVVGLRYAFTKAVAQTMDVLPNGTDIINVGSAGGLLVLTNVGSSVFLECRVTGKWVAVNSNGAYTVA